MRNDVNPSVDARIFRNTASHTKKINLMDKVYRGGIRL